MTGENFISRLYTKGGNAKERKIDIELKRISLDPITTVFFANRDKWQILIYMDKKQAFAAKDASQEVVNNLSEFLTVFAVTGTDEELFESTVWALEEDGYTVWSGNLIASKL